MCWTPDRIRWSESAGAVAVHGGNKRKEGNAGGAEVTQPRPSSPPPPRPAPPLPPSSLSACLSGGKPFNVYLFTTVCAAPCRIAPSHPPLPPQQISSADEMTMVERHRASTVASSMLLASSAPGTPLLNFGADNRPTHTTPSVRLSIGPGGSATPV